MSEPTTVREAAQKIGVTKQRVHALMGKGRIRVVNRTGQARDHGRFGPGGAYLLASDVEREAAARGHHRDVSCSTNRRRESMTHEDAPASAEVIDVDHAEPEPSNAIVVTDVVTPPGPSEWRSMRETAATIARTDFVPSEMRGKPDVVLAAILTGREMGLGPMASLQGIRIQDGKPAYDAELMRALVRKRGHSLKVVEKSHERCILRGRRRDTGEEGEVTWTLQDALIAGLIQSIDTNGMPVARSKNGYPMPWEKFPRRMLFARATSELVADLFADVLVGGSYTPEELDPVGWDEPEASPGPAYIDPKIGELASPEVGSPEYESQRRNLAFRKIKDAIGSDADRRVKAQEVAERLGVFLPQSTAAQAEDVAAHVIRFFETGELPADPREDAPTSPQATQGATEPESAPSAPQSLPERVLAAAETKWKPTAGDTEASADPIEERGVLLTAAAEVINSLYDTEENIRTILGHDGKKDVAKALGAARITDLRAAVDLLEGEEQRRREEVAEDEKPF